MSLYVTDECTCCSACLSECPVDAITLPDIAHIDLEACDECGGEPRCQPVCPVECILPLAQRAA